MGWITRADAMERLIEQGWTTDPPPGHQAVLQL